MEMTNIDHVGVATQSIDEATVFWETLGLVSKDDHVNHEQGVRIRILEGRPGSPTLELLQPLGSDTPVGNFIEKRGEGIQQIAFAVDDIKHAISKLIQSGYNMINEEPTKGAGGTLIAFVHPSSTGGVLVELVQRN